MEQITQIGTLNGGKVFVPTLITGYSPSPDNEYVFFLQSRCRIVLKEMTSAVRMSIAYNNGMQPVEMTYFPDISGNIHAPLTDILAAYFERVDNDTLSLSGMDGYIDMFAIDANGNILGHFGMILVTCYCSALRSGYPGGGFDHLMPDTFRLPSSPLYREVSYVGCRLTHGVNLVELVSGGNTYSHYQAFSDGRAVGCNLNLKGAPSVMRVYEDTDTMLQEAHFDLVDCLDDKVFLKWWSCEDGIWKTRVADVAGEGVAINGTDNYMRDFADRQAKASTAFVAARFDSLTSRDYCYYRDLLTSDEVYVIAPADTAALTGELSAIRVTIGGDIPTAKQNKRTNIDFNINYSNFSEL